MTIQSNETVKNGYVLGMSRGRGAKTASARYISLTPYEALRWDAVKDAAMECDRLGYYSAVLPDHIMGEGGQRYEAWTLMAAVAAVTKRVKLHHLVLANGFRHAPWLAKAAMTLDHISRGRFILGIGAGWAKEEFEAYGYGYPKYRARVDQLDEALEVIKLLWTGERVSYNGKFYRLQNAICNPTPLQKPRPPIVVGGGGRRLLKVAAKHADIINLSGGSTEEVRRKLDVLEEQCRELGRDFDKIEKSWGRYLFIAEDEKEMEENRDTISAVPAESITAGTAEKVIDEIQAFADIGITYITYRFEELPSLKGIRLFAERVMPAFS